MRPLLFLAMLLAPIAYAQTPALTIDRGAGPIRVGISGQPGATYKLESASNLSATSWDFRLTSPFTNSFQTWFDATSVSAPQRFYRAIKLGSPPSDFADDFRLLDQLGRSRWLFYDVQNTNIQAIVLIFTGNGCQKIQDMIPVIKALTNRFSPQGISFWLVDSNPQDDRSNILAEAISLGISNGPPILDDTADLVARAYNATTTPEAVAISMKELSIFYRGAIDDRIASNAVATTQYYLSNALVSFLSGSTITPNRSQPNGCVISLTPPFTNISYSADIAPLLLNKCVRCHSPGNIAPWAMTNFAIIHAYAPLMKLELMAGRMPPWKADPYYGSFTNDFSLKPNDLQKLVQWLSSGATKSPAEPDPLTAAPTQTNYPFAWPASLGQPDAVLSIPQQSIPATGVLSYRYVNLTNNAFPSNVWLRAAVVRPSNIRVVHHSLVFDGTSTGMGLDGFFAGYVPGADATTFPPGTGKYLTNGQVLQFQMHYITMGSNQTDQTQIGLYTMPGRPTYPLQTKSAYNVLFSVPANANTYEAVAKFPPPPIFDQTSSPVLATNILLYEMSPHMHLRGGHFKYEVIYPTGHVPASEVLLSVPKYAFQWQSMFRLTQPKLIPKGSRILCTAGWDNTAQNVDLMQAYADSGGDSLYAPTRTVGFGEQTYDEMFIGYLDYAEVP